jgi:catechol 2,3-dioxygenase-like lactoylglutathione lyase family enzyme
MIIDLNHVNIVTAKVGETREFYERVLGLKTGYRPPFDFDGAWLYAGDKPVIHLQALDSSPNARPGDRGRAGPLDHASFEVADIGLAKAALDQNNISYQGVTSPDGRNHQVFFRDPNGVVIELIARASKDNAA